MVYYNIGNQKKGHLYGYGYGKNGYKWGHPYGLGGYFWPGYQSHVYIPGDFEDQSYGQKTIKTWHYIIGIMLIIIGAILIISGLKGMRF